LLTDFLRYFEEWTFNGETFDIFEWEESLKGYYGYPE